MLCNEVVGATSPAPSNQHPASASMASTNTNTTTSPSSKAITDANDAHQCTNDVLAWTLTLVHDPHDLLNLAALHGDVN